MNITEYIQFQFYVFWFEKDYFSVLYWQSFPMLDFNCIPVHRNIVVCHVIFFVITCTYDGSDFIFLFLSLFVVDVLCWLNHLPNVALSCFLFPFKWTPCHSIKQKKDLRKCSWSSKHYPLLDTFAFIWRT